MTKITTDAEALAVLDDAVFVLLALFAEKSGKLRSARDHIAARLAQHERIVAGLEADARRYRWLRDMPSLTAEKTVGAIEGQGVCMRQRDSLDAAIDAFLAQTAEGRSDD